LLDQRDALGLCSMFALIAVEGEPTADSAKQP